MAEHRSSMVSGRSDGPEPLAIREILGAELTGENGLERAAEHDAAKAVSQSKEELKRRLRELREASETSGERASQS